LTVLFIAAMTMQEVPVQESEMGQLGARSHDPQPLFKEIVEILPPAPLALDNSLATTPSQPVAFALPPASLSSPPVETAPASLVAPSPPPAPASLANPAKQAPLTASEIEVQKGDSLEKLAKQYQTSVDEIIQLNQLPTSFLKIGQRLKIPAGKRIEISKPKSAISLGLETAEYYTMKVGDNPWSVAMKHHMKVDELLKLNGLNEKTARKLKPGDRLRIK
jgi:peptidoglycan DL-endopeptidase LytF